MDDIVEDDVWLCEAEPVPDIDAVADADGVCVDDDEGVVDCDGDPDLVEVIERDCDGDVVMLRD